MASLYEINSEINDLFNRYTFGSVEGEMIDTETGEVIHTIDVMLQLNSLNLEREAKLDAYAFMVKNDSVFLEGVTAEIKRLQGLKKSVEKRDEFLINVLAHEYEGKNHKDKSGRYSVTFRKSKAVNILDESVIPEVFLVPQPPKISKMEIKKAIESGAIVPGAEIKQNVSCSVK